MLTNQKPDQTMKTQYKLRHKNGSGVMTLSPDQITESMYDKWTPDAQRSAPDSDMEAARMASEGLEVKAGIPGAFVGNVSFTLPRGLSVGATYGALNDWRCAAGVPYSALNYSTPWEELSTCPSCGGRAFIETPPAIYDEEEKPKAFCPNRCFLPQGEPIDYVLGYFNPYSEERILARSWADLEACFVPIMPDEWEDAKRALIDDEKSRFERTDFSTPEDNYILARDPDLSDEEWEGAEWVSEPSETCNFGGTAR